MKRLTQETGTGTGKKTLPREGQTFPPAGSWLLNIASMIRSLLEEPKEKRRGVNKK